MPGQIVASLSLSHFRSYRRAGLEFDGRPVAIWGVNGAGKTNILEAVSMLSPGRGLRRAAVEDMARRPEALGWKVGAVIADPGQAAQEIETWSEGTGRQLRINGKAAPQVALGRVIRILWLTPLMDRLWLEGAEGRRRFLDRIAMSFRPDHAQAVLDYDKAMRERNRLLRDQVVDPAWYGVLETRMDAAAVVIADNRSHALDRLHAAQTAAETGFPAADLCIDTPDDPGPEPGALGVALAANRRRDMAAGRSLIGPHRADLAAIYSAKGVRAEQCSTGEQKALLISLILSNARGLAAETGAPPVVLLDEVAAHLDSGRRGMLYDEICALGAQALMTGTEPGLFAGLGCRAQGVEVDEAGGTSRAVERTLP